MLLLVLSSVTLGLWSSVSARTYYIPSRQNTVISSKNDRLGYLERRQGEMLDEFGNGVEDGFEYIGLEEYPKSARKIPKYYNNGKKYYKNDPYEDISFHPPDPVKHVPRCKPEVRSLPPIVISDRALSHLGLSIVKLLKTLTVVMLIVGVPALLFQFVVIPFKLLAGLKMLAMTHIVTLLALAANYMFKHKAPWGGHPGGWAGSGGWLGPYGPLIALGGYGLGGLAAISTPVTSSNVNQPISQPVTQLISNPVNQYQNVGNYNGGAYNCGCCGFPVWAIPWLINLINNTSSNSNSNTNINTNINSNSNNNTNSNNNNNNNNTQGNNGNNGNNGNGNNGGNGGNGNNEHKQRTGKAKRTLREIFSLEPEDFKTMTESEILIVMKFLRRKHKRFAGMQLDVVD